MTSPFKGLKDKIIELDIGGKKIRLQPKVEDAELFLTMKQEMDVQSAKVPTRVLMNMIQRANPEANAEDIRIFITLNYGEFLMKIAPIFGFKTDMAAIEKLKKKVE